MPPGDAAASRIQDAAGNDAAAFSGQAAANHTPLPGNRAATGQPSIVGTAQVGETLTIDTSTITDLDGMTGATFSYQWISNGGTTDTYIQGANGSTYQLASADEGKTVKVQVTFPDDGGTTETLTSVATDVVTSLMPVGICGRTRLVREALLEKIHGIDHCSQVTVEALNRVAGTLDLTPWQLVALKPMDFQHLSSLEKLDLGFNLWLDELPEGVFDDLTGLKELDLFAIDSGNLQLPGGIFDNLASLESLDVSFNHMTELPEGVFDGLSNLKELKLSGNDLAELPEGVFDNLVNLEILEIISQEANVALTALPNGVFDNLSSLKRLDLFNNELSELPADVFDNLTNLEDLELTNNNLSELPEGAFEGISNLKRLRLGGNPGAPFTFTAGLEQQGSDVVVKLSEAGPFDMTVTVSAQGGTLSVGTVTAASVTVTVKAGTNTSEAITVTPDTGQTQATVNVDSAAFPDYEIYTFSGAQTATGPALVIAALSSQQETVASESSTGLPTIGGTPEVDQTLTADTSGITDEDGLTNVRYTYQWIRSDGNGDTDIAGETTSTYDLTNADVGKTIKVRVSFTDDADNEEILTSAATVEVVAKPNTAPTGKPTIGGTPQVEETLTADTANISDQDGLTNVSYSYQWIAGGTDIDGATGSTYTLTASEQGQTIQVRVTFTDDADNEETLTSAATVAVAPVPLTAAFQDLPDSHDGSTAFTFRVLFSEDVGISYVNMRDDAFSLSEGGVTGARRVDGRNDLWEITVEPDDNSDVGITLPANRSCTTTGAICTREDSPRQLTNSPTATVTGPAEAPPTNTSAAGEPTISGTPRVEQTLTADTSSITDEDGLTNVSYSYQWMAGGSDIAGATGSTYTLTYSEQGQTIQVRVTFTDDADNEETLTSIATVAVAAAPNREATGQPAIGGTPQVGETLTADTAGITDADGLTNVSYEYQWLASGTDIGGATGSSYVLTSSEQGQTIQVRVTFTDDADNDESLTSTATETVLARPNRAAAGLPTISGTPQVDETLTADTSAISDEDGLTNVSWSYQWTAGGTDIEGAASSTYTLVFADQGKTIKVKVSFTDDANNAETLTSVATLAVASAPNHEATGQPTISGTPQVAQTLTADTSPIDDADGLTNVSYSYQWTAGGSDIGGATGSTYTLTSSEQGKTIQVKVTFTDDRDNAEALTSIATAAVAAAPEPLTVRLKVAAPASHDGSSEFTFEIEFSEEFGISYATLRDHAFTVTGGSVETAQRTDKPSNIPWRITVKPQGTGDVTVELPATTDCGDEGAICTQDGRKLSNSLSFTVSGPGQ